MVGKSVLSSLADLRSFYARQPRGSTLWFFVPEVSVWTQTLAQEFRTRNGGQERFVVPEGTARGYCSLYRSDTRFHVMPRDTLAKEQAFAVIYPPSGSTQKGAVMAGRYLVDRPDWQETDYLSFTTSLSPTQEGLPEARAHVWGYISQANLKARVEFKELFLGNPSWIWWVEMPSFNGKAYPGDWDGKDTFSLGNGSEVIGITLPSTPPTTWTQVSPARDAQGRDRGYAQVYASGTWELSGEQSQNYSGSNIPPWRFTFGGDFGRGWETFTLRWKDPILQVNQPCGKLFLGTTNTYPITCEVVDAEKRVRGTAEVSRRTGTSPVSPYLYDYSIRVQGWTFRVQGWRVRWYLSQWQARWRYATDNDRPVEAGGYVTAEGKRYRIPGLEATSCPRGRTWRWPRATLT